MQIKIDLFFHKSDPEPTDKKGRAMCYAVMVFFLFNS